MIKAIDFTSKGDEDNITVKHKNETIQIKKKFVEPTELFETGVYNSESDTKTNPKTGENTPDAAAAVISRVSQRIEEIVTSLDELRLFVKDNSTLSHESLDSCITELTAYTKSMEEESKNASSNSVN